MPLEGGWKGAGVEDECECGQSERERQREGGKKRRSAAKKILVGRPARGGAVFIALFAARGGERAVGRGSLGEESTSGGSGGGWGRTREQKKNGKWSF